MWIKKNMRNAQFQWGKKIGKGRKCSWGFEKHKRNWSREFSRSLTQRPPPPLLSPLLAFCSERESLEGMLVSEDKPMLFRTPAPERLYGRIWAYKGFQTHGTGIQLTKMARVRTIAQWFFPPCRLFFAQLIAWLVACLILSCEGQLIVCACLWRNWHDWCSMTMWANRILNT